MRLVLCPSGTGTCLLLSAPLEVLTLLGLLTSLSLRWMPGLWKMLAKLKLVCVGTLEMCS
jgi:hypothetical protein